MSASHLLRAPALDLLRARRALHAVRHLPLRADDRVLILSFQGPSAALVFPLRDPSLIWFDDLFNPRRTGDVAGAFDRSLPLALIVMVLTVLISVTAGFAFRRRFPGSGADLLPAIASLIVPGLVLSIGILVTFRYLGFSAAWYTSALGAQLSWTLPFGLLIMFAVLGRLNPSYEEAAYDLGASKWQTVKEVVVCRSSSPASSRSRCSASRSPTTSSRAAG